MALGVLVDPAVVDQPDRYRVEEVQLLPPRSGCDTQARPLESTQVLQHAEARHGQLGLEFGERLAVPLEQPVEQVSPRRVGERLEDGIVVHDRGQYVTKWSHVNAAPTGPRGPAGGNNCYSEACADRHQVL